MYEWINTASGAITTNFFFRLVICVLVNFSLSPSFLQREEGPRHEIHRHVPLQEPRRDKTKTTGDHLSLEGHRSSPTGLERPSGTGVESVVTKSCRTAPFSLQWGSRVPSHQCSLQRKKNKQTNKQTCPLRASKSERVHEKATHTHTHTLQKMKWGRWFPPTRELLLPTNQIPPSSRRDGGVRLRSPAALHPLAN